MPTTGDRVLEAFGRLLRSRRQIQLEAENETLRATIARARNLLSSATLYAEVYSRDAALEIEEFLEHTKERTA